MQGELLVAEVEATAAHAAEVLTAMESPPSSPAAAATAAERHSAPAAGAEGAVLQLLHTLQHVLELGVKEDWRHMGRGLLGAREAAFVAARASTLQQPSALAMLQVRCTSLSHSVCHCE